ncbi:MAG: FeoA domain-containing protein [Firmicutes bacterium]|nr:FeoA domain-containing protein [Bacillota bacterium]
MLLSNLQPGKVAVISKVFGSDAVKATLFDLGFFPSCVVKIEKSTKANNVMILNVNGVNKCIRGNVAKFIAVSETFSFLQ